METFEPTAIYTDWPDISISSSVCCPFSKNRIISLVNQAKNEFELSGQNYAVTGAASAILEKGAAKPYVLNPCE
jgi:hypothetical protein